ncbi:54S ribosomal protein L4 mitochondrial [Lunasporangiospora selenospora]|uniref:Large ribosomal subunit protein uL4m n=1 Tax=Lunasporangiospora selenospora TaxID=979761 RepID=A0A9P6FLP3_9FUNG|nr:54S ribosomal protein L4 mitochondrial [Lunasporangiospora selenospora]
MASLFNTLRTGLASQPSTGLRTIALARFSTFRPALAEVISTPNASTPAESQPSSTGSTVKETLSPFVTPLQAWVRDFKTNEPMDMINLQRKVFGAPLRKDILHRVVVWQRDAERQGTHSTKGRSDVSGTSRKAAPQKGRGAARVGSLRAPQRRGGGIVFGPKPRDHSSDLPRKVQEMGLRIALSTKFSQDQLVIVDDLEMDSHKTKEFERIRDQHGWDSVLVVANKENENLWRATRNLQQVDCAVMQEADVLRLLKHQLVIMDRQSVRYLEKKLKV